VAQGIDDPFVLTATACVAPEASPAVTSYADVDSNAQAQHGEGGSDSEGEQFGPKSVFLQGLSPDGGSTPALERAARAAEKRAQFVEQQQQVTMRQQAVQEAAADAERKERELQHGMEQERLR
jgi:hypothetical protein